MISYGSLQLLCIVEFCDPFENSTTIPSPYPCRFDFLMHAEVHSLAFVSNAQMFGNEAFPQTRLKRNATLQQGIGGEKNKRLLHWN